MKTVNLTKGYTAFVDDEDYDRVSLVKWTAYTQENGHVHAATNRTVDGRCTYLPLASWILWPPPGRTVDHVNREPLDNRRSNLRLATRAQQNANQRKRSDNTSGYRGVGWDKRRAKWCALIQHNKPGGYIGVFATAEEAARAYDLEAIKRFGPFAVLNFSMSDDAEGR